MSRTVDELFHAGADRDLAKGETLFRLNDTVEAMYLVLDGTLDLIRHTDTGDRMVLMRANAGQVLAEASAYSDVYHCDCVAASAAKVRRIRRDIFHQMLEAEPALARLWAAKLAHQLQGARMNAEIRGLKTVAARLDAWLVGKQKLPEKGQWQSLAQELGVSREALYRELAKRRSLRC